MKKYLIQPASEILYSEAQRTSYYLNNERLSSRITYHEKRFQPEISMILNSNLDFYEGTVAQAQYKWSANVSHLLYDVLSDHFVLRDLVGTRALVCRPVGLIHQIIDFLDSRLIMGEFPAPTEVCVPDPMGSFSYLDLNGWRHGGHKHSYLSSVIRKTFSKLMIEDPSLPKNIVINRKLTSGHPIRNRNIDNLKTFIDELKILGLDFQVLELEDLTLSQQIKYFYNAERILSIHGSGLVWLNFCRQATKVVEVLSPWFKQGDYLKHDFWVIGNNAGLNYKSLYVEDIVGDASSPYDYNVLLNANVIFELFND